MQKNIFIKFLILVVISFTIFSCKKSFLDTSPTDSADDAAIFSTTSNARNVINGIYRYLYSRYDGQNTPGHGGLMINNDFMGEDINQSASNWYTSAGGGTGGWISHRNDQSGWVTYPFRLYYRAIGNANALLDNIDNATGTDNEKNVLKAEAKAMRGWAYFNLVQYFAQRYNAATKPNSQLGVSMPLSAADIQLPRSTVEEVYTQINKDLDESIETFKGVTGTFNKSHLSINAAKAIKARVALTMQDYTTAITYANDIINSASYSLMDTVAYKSGFNNAANTEWIWAAIIIPDHGDTFGSYFGQISYNGNTTYVRSQPKRINSVLYGQIPETDVRKRLWEPTPTTANFPLPLATFTRQPYMSRKFSISTPSTTLGDVPYIRLAEMYLILAEAYAKTTGSEGLAQTTLFNLVSKRDPNYVKSTKTGQDLINEILFYRRIELWGEGFRFFDLKRLNQPLVRSTVPNYVAASVGVMDVAAGDVRWQFLLPISEIQANPNTKQNPAQ